MRDVYKRLSTLDSSSKTLFRLELKVEISSIDASNRMTTDS